MIKPDRKDLVIRVVRLANLPPCKETSDYLTREQLVELVMFIEGTKELLTKLKEGYKCQKRPVTRR